ncbi:hypothetical protein [Selenomonas sp. KH1T6]|uniref:hypothetical protein n=1 Tax=Selenomonas sp. KH1T6 TaxID=3158784 RepID=UPI00158740C8
MEEVPDIFTDGRALPAKNKAGIFADTIGVARYRVSPVFPSHFLRLLPVLHQRFRNLTVQLVQTVAQCLHLLGVGGLLLYNLLSLGNVLLYLGNLPLLINPSDFNYVYRQFQ